LPNLARLDRWTSLAGAMRRLRAARSPEEGVAILRDSARAIAASDGITVVRRERDEVAYVAEDAISPLWTGQRFPITLCVSGMAILTGEPILIPDIRMDARVPLNAYLSTFVESMAMFPIGAGAPVAAMGAYWRTARPIDREAVALLTDLARAAGPLFTAELGAPLRKAS
jgi:hypothetical protein